MQNVRGESRQARDRVFDDARATVFKGASLRAQIFVAGRIVSTCSKYIKDASCLAVNYDVMSASVAVATYNKRFSIEENFRDLKNPRCSMGLSASRVNFLPVATG